MWDSNAPEKHLTEFSVIQCDPVYQSWMVNGNTKRICSAIHWGGSEHCSLNDPQTTYISCAWWHNSVKEIRVLGGLKKCKYSHTEELS